MATITNKTGKPLSVPLPGGKKLHLGPLNSGEIAPRAIDHPPVQKLIEAGQVEVDTSDQKQRGSGSRGKGASSETPDETAHGGVIRRTGER